MATMFPQTLGQPDPTQAYAPTGYVIPPELQAQLVAIERRRNAPQAPAFTPEQVAQRRDDNERQYALGVLGGMSGDEGLQNVGGTVLKQALANRQAKISERGTTDPLSGQFQYSPDYLAQRDDSAEAAVQQRIAQGRQQWDQGRQSAAERRQLAEQQSNASRETRMMIAGLAGANRPEKLIAVIGPDGMTPTLVPASQAAGMQPVGGGKGGGNASEDERKAAGWVAQARLAFQNMQDAVATDAKASKPTGKEKLIGLVPGVGEDLAYAAMTPGRQKFTTAASSLSEAVLRAATGAGVNKEEAMQKVRELTPRWGEDKSVTAMKQQGAEMYIGALEARAGRALPKAVAATQPAAPYQRNPQGPARAAPPAADGWSIQRE